MLALLKRDLFELKRNLIFYFALFSLSPIILYLLLAIPLSYFISVEVMYLNWSSTGIWVASSVIISLIGTSIRIHKLKYQTNQMEAILTAPITNLFFLFSILMRGLFLGMIQFLFSYFLTAFLTNEYLGLLNVLIIIIHMILALIFFSLLGILFGLIIENTLFLIQSMLALFILLCLGMGIFIPISSFPISYSIILNKVPLVLLFNNIQNIIIHKEVNWVWCFLTLILSIIMFCVTLIISNKVFRKI